MNDYETGFMAGAGWMYAFACTKMDGGKDIRLLDITEIVEEARKALQEVPESLLP